MARDSSFDAVDAALVLVSPPTLLQGSYRIPAHAHDGLTSISIATVGGTINVADAGRVVTVYDSAPPVGTTLAGNDRNLTLAGVTLSPGTKLLTAQAAKPEGTGTLQVFAATLDTSTFVSPIANSALTIGTDGKSYINAAHFNGGVTTLSGTAEPGDTVTVVDRTGKSVVGNAAVKADGSWTVTVSGLKDGNTDSYVATATDAAGNVASSRPLTFTVDLTASVSIKTTGAVVTHARQTISGTIAPTDVTPGAVVMLFDNGATTPIGIATVGVDGSWSTAVDFFGKGTHSIVAKQADAAGNVGTSAPAVFTLVDTPAATTLASFAGIEGSTLGALVADASGNLFGTTSSGGAYGFGSVFEIAKSADGYAGTPTTLVSFNSHNGSGPAGPLIIDANGNLFGTTAAGGNSNYGTVFKIAKTANGYDSTPTPLVLFNGTNGSRPNGILIADANGNLFGTTSSGGANDSGTVFEIAKSANGYDSAPTTLASLDGKKPNFLMLDTSGNLVGTAADGTIFQIAKTGDGYASTLTSMGQFGAVSVSAPTADASGNLFVTFSSTYDFLIYKFAKTGNGYATTPTFVAKYSNDGANPNSGANSPLIIDAKGNLFGTTFSTVSGGGVYVTVFEIAKTADGYANHLTTLVSLNASGPLILNTNSGGSLFGTTNTGTVFEITKTGYVPAVAIAGILPGAGVGGAVLSGTANGGLTVSVYSGSTLLGTTTAAADGNWNFATLLAPGTNNFTVSATDAANKRWTSVLTANLVSSATATISVPTSGAYFVEGAGTLNVVYGATITGATVAGGGTEYAGGVANGTSILGGGTEVVTGMAISAVVSAGGGQNVISGGTALSTMVKAGGYQGVANATVTGTTLFGNQQILAGGTAYATLVNSGAEQYVGAGGNVSGTTVNSGGLAYVDAGGKSNGAIINSGGYEMVVGESIGSTINNGGVQDNLGLASGTVVAAGGSQQVNNGGSAVDTTVNAGGFQSVQSGGTAYGTTLNGYQQVLAGGTAVGTVVNAGGNEYVGSGGQTTGTVVGTRGLQYVDAGATDSDSVVFGGLQYVAGTATGTTIDAGGEQDVGAGGTAVDTYLVRGTEHVYAGGTANGADFGGSSAATLILDHPSLFFGTIANFGSGDQIDFRDVTSASIDGAGHLTMTTGGGNYSWALMGQYAAAEFALTDDGFGGTMLTFHPADTAHTVGLVSHA